MNDAYDILEMPPDELGEPRMIELTSGTLSSHGREAYSVGSLPPGSLPPGEYVGSLPPGEHVGSLPPGEHVGSLPPGSSLGQGQREPRFKGNKR